MSSLEFMKLTFFFIFLSFSTLSFSADDIPLRIGVVQEYGQFNPVTMNLASTEALLHFVMREMTTRNEKGELIPDLAEKIPSLENKLAKINHNKLIAEWTIKESAKWSDGRPVVCQDWWLGWQAGLSANTMTQEKTLYTKIENISWLPAKQKKCTVTYTTPSWTFDRDLPYPIPYHLENAVFEKWKNQKEAYDQNSLFVTAPATLGLYNGPYQVQEFKLGSHFILTKNSFFYGRPAKIEKIMVKHIGDASTLTAHLKTGSINMVSAVGYPPDLALNFAETEKESSSEVFLQDSPVFQGIFFNHENEFLKEIAVRKALALSIDKKKLVDAFFNGRFKPAETFLPPNSAEFKVKPPSRDLNQARKLLIADGWLETGKKFRVKNNRELIIDFKTSSGIKILETIQVFLCNEFAKIQVGCSIKNQPPRTLLGDTITKGDFGMAMFGNSIVPDTSLTSLFSSHEIPTKENSWTGGNNMRWKSPAMDQLLKKFDTENNPVKRNLVLRKMEDEILNQVAFIPIYHRKEAAIIPKSLKGFTYLGKGTNFMFPEKWTLN